MMIFASPSPVFGVDVEDFFVRFGSGESLVSGESTGLRFLDAAPFVSFSGDASGFALALGILDSEAECFSLLAFGLVLSLLAGVAKSSRCVCAAVLLRVDTMLTFEIKYDCRYNPNCKRLERALSCCSRRASSSIAALGAAVDRWTAKSLDILAVPKELIYLVRIFD
jgi:hypothetical protein